MIPSWSSQVFWAFAKIFVETLVFLRLLLEVLLGLLDADEGGGDFHLHDRLAGSSLFKAGEPPCRSNGPW